MPKNRLWKKGLVFCIIILFVGANVVSGLNIQLKNTTYPSSSYTGNILYVGGSGPGNYSSIQEAIYNASDGDTVFVFSGTYEQAEIGIVKRINLIGENRNTTIIREHNGRSIIRFYVDGITVSGFTLEEIASINEVQHILDIYSSNNIITNNIFKADGKPAMSIEVGRKYNIIADNIVLKQCWFVIGGMYTTVRNNTFIDSYGIIIGLNTGHIVENNTINGKPIYYYHHQQNISVPLDASQVILLSCENFIIENIIFTNTVEGIYLDHSSNIIIRNNTITGSLKSGIELDDSSFNIISNNIISNNGEYGLNIWHTSCVENFVSKNIITDNSEMGIYDLGTKTTISENYIANNSRCGIFDVGTETTISENYIANNGYGIDIWTDSNTITSNIITNNINGGIIIDISNSNKIENNTITNNGERGIYLIYGDFWGYGGWERETSNNNYIYGNFISGHKYGIRILFDCNSNTIYHNNINYNSFGVFIDVSDGNNVFENNFIKNTKSLYFRTFRNFKLQIDRNYWDDWPFSGIPKKISGKKALACITIFFLLYRYYCFFIPFSIYDYHPVKEPYNIP